MARIAGIDLPNNKRGEIALTYIYGIGRSTAQQILDHGGISWDKKAGEWNEGRVIVKGKLSTRGEAKRADYVLYHRSNLPIAVIEAKDNNHAVGAGMQQALGYAELLDAPFIFSSNGDGFLFHDATSSTPAASSPPGAAACCSAACRRSRSSA